MNDDIPFLDQSAVPAPPARAVGSAGATAAVLWLMILLVFLPIGAAHLVALALDGGTGQQAAGE